MAEDHTDRSMNRGWYNPQMGRTRSLLAATERIGNQETPPPPGRGPGIPQMGRGRDLPPPSPPQIGGSRARARGLLLEMTERQYPAPNPVSYPLGRGRGLRSLSPPHPGSRSSIRALPPTPSPGAPGLGRARSRALTLPNFQEPPTSS